MNYLKRKNGVFVQKHLEFRDNLIKLRAEISNVGESRVDLSDFWDRIQSAEIPLPTNDSSNIADLIVFVAQERYMKGTLVFIRKSQM